MKTRILGFLIASFLAVSIEVRADNPVNGEALKILATLKYQHGDLTLTNSFARLSVPTNFNYLGPSEAETVITRLWGNPPPTNHLLGLLLPADKTPIQPGCWAVVIYYSEEGFVRDDAAAHISYNDLLKRMQDQVHQNNHFLAENGYPTVELLGWAMPPHYDAATHELYWAKTFQFAGRDQQTVNYDIRILGRSGMLMLRAVAQMDQLDEINQNTPQILRLFSFIEGHRYEDFIPQQDKVAKYDVSGLVSGGLAETAPAEPAKPAKPAKPFAVNPYWIGVWIIGTAAASVLAVFFGVKIGRSFQITPHSTTLPATPK